jgi:hypothetical protein
VSHLDEGGVLNKFLQESATLESAQFVSCYIAFSIKASGVYDVLRGIDNLAANGHFFFKFLSLYSVHSSFV